MKSIKSVYFNTWPIQSVLCLLLVSVLGAACTRKAKGIPDTSNSMFRGNPLHQGVSMEQPFTNVELKWKFHTNGAIRGSAIISGDTLLMGSADHHVYALNRLTGMEFWKFKTEGAVCSTPAVKNGKVFFASRDHLLYAVDLSSGKLLWKVNLGEADAHKWGWDYFVSSPTIIDDQLVIGTEDGRIISVDLNNGTEIWSVQTKGRVRSSPAIANGVAYVGSFDSYLYAIDLKEGKLNWTFETDGKHFNSDSSGWDRNSIDSSPAIVDSTLIFGSRDGNVYALNTHTGELLWKKTYGPTWSLASPAIDKETVFTGWSDNFLFTALDLRTGNEKWKYRCGYYVYSSPLVTDTIVYVGSHDRNLYAFNTNTGSKVWQFRTDGSILSSPIISEDLLYVGSDDGNLYALQRSTKKPIKKAVYVAQIEPKYYPIDPRLAPFLVSCGYEQLDTLTLEAFIKQRLEVKDESVIVFATDRVPSLLLKNSDGSSLLKKYLSDGGKIIWLGAIPNLYQFDANGLIIGEDVTLAEQLLGISFDATHDWGEYNATATPEGKALKLPDWWIGSYSIKMQEGITVLGLNDLNRPTAWLKKFNNSPGAGFYQFRPWGTNRTAKDSELEMIKNLAEQGY